MISSASTTLANTPPGRNSNSSVPRFQTDTPVTSDGRRSGVNWMRLPGAADRAGDRLGQRGLAHAGDVLDEEVALGEEAHEREVDLLALALDDPLDVVEQGGEQAAERRVAARRGGGLNHDYLQSGRTTVPERVVARVHRETRYRAHTLRTSRRPPSARSVVAGPAFGGAPAARAARPALWATALRQALAPGPAAMVARAPFLPLPDPDYLRFRLRDPVRGRRATRPARPGRLPRVVPEMRPGRLRSPTTPTILPGGRCRRLGRALLLNASFEPLCVVPMRRAVVLVLKEKAEIVARNGAGLHSERAQLPGPVGDPAAPLRAGAVPQPGAALAAGGVRP